MGMTMNYWRVINSLSLISALICSALAFITLELVNQNTLHNRRVFYFFKISTFPEVLLFPNSK